MACYLPGPGTQVVAGLAPAARRPMRGVTREDRGRLLTVCPRESLTSRGAQLMNSLEHSRVKKIQVSARSIFYICVPTLTFCPAG